MNEIRQLNSKARSWQVLVEEQLSSGQSIRVFCEGRHLSPHTFGYWKRKFQKLGSTSPRSRFISIARKVSLAGGFPRIHLPNGVSIDLGEGLESGVVSEFLQNLCGVGHSVLPKEGRHAKP